MQCRYEDIGYWGIPGIHSLFTDIILQKQNIHCTKRELSLPCSNYMYSWHLHAVYVIGISVRLLLLFFRDTKKYQKKYQLN